MPGNAGEKFRVGIEVGKDNERRDWNVVRMPGPGVNRRTGPVERPGDGFRLVAREDALEALADLS